MSGRDEPSRSMGGQADGAATDPTGSVQIALDHASRLLQSRPDLAVEQAGEILKAVPNHPVATLLLGIGQRLSGNLDAALETLKALTDAQHRWALAFYELGLTVGEAGDHRAAATAFRRAVELKPDMPDAWRSLGDELTMSGDAAGADAAYANQIKASTQDPRLMTAAAALCENDIPRAESLLRAHLKSFPTDVAAIRMFAEVAARLGRFHDAENLLTRCLELAPSFNAARHNYVQVLVRLNKLAEALREAELLCASEPRNSGFRNLKAVVLARVGDLRQSVEIYADILAKHPGQSRIWLNYGHALATAGREVDAISAYRRSIALDPGFGEGYWSLANLKTFRFNPSEVSAMRSQLKRPELTMENRFHLHFALGKALEDAGDYADSFVQYGEGNRLRRRQVGYNADKNTELVQRLKGIFTSHFLSERAGRGCDAADPIFIVGLPRAGSTLIEQILASHSAVEGTMELPDLNGIAGGLNSHRAKGGEPGYPEVIARLKPDDFERLGRQYLDQTRIQRKLGKPFFIDKMPNNFYHVGLLRLILPRAKIIDARRHPMACCFSAFKQHFARGQNFSYSLPDLGRYYRDYVELMAHFDRVLPGAVHRVIHETLVENTETEVRRLLAYCGLPFEPGCLKFYENDRAVRTASAQQVRQPISRAGLDQWRKFESWLNPLSAALGRVATEYPDVTEF